MERILTADARVKAFRQKLLKLGYVKKETLKVKEIMEKISDFEMMSDAGNKKGCTCCSTSKI